MKKKKQKIKKKKKAKVKHPIYYVMQKSSINKVIRL